jgi:hypothetical protein
MCSASAKRCQETNRKNLAVKSLKSTAQTVRSVYRMDDDTYPTKYDRQDRRKM